MPAPAAFAEPSEAGTSSGRQSTRISSTDGMLGPIAPKALMEKVLAANEKAQQAKRLSKGEKAVKTAKKYLGTPYVYGGASPSGFDCSGFTMYVYGKLGVELPHNAQAQYSCGKHVSRSELKAGDLVFFGSGGYIGHVGIYVGGGKFVHSPNTGDVVKVQTLSSRTNYVGATRLS